MWADGAPPEAALRSWPLATGHELAAQLWAAYADPARGYHDTRHLSEVLGRVDELAPQLQPRLEESALQTVRLAAWFHDAVYDGERDAEERSAAWAERALPGLVDDAAVAEVARLVRVTETHRPTPEDRAGALLSDADLGILAAPPERYAAYTHDVRTEYAHLDDATFAAGRAALLADLLDVEHVFHTDAARRAWEQAARANVQRELAALAH